MASGKDAQLDLSDLEAYVRQQPSPVILPAYLSTGQSLPNNITPPLQGRVAYDEPGGNLWGTIGKVLAGIGRAASAFGNGTSAPSYANQSNDLQLSEYRAQHIQKPKDIALQPILQTQSRNTARNMINLVADINEKRHEREMRWAQKQHKFRNFMDDVAKSQGLTSYEQFHRDHGIEYNLGPSIANTASMADVINPRGQSSGFIKEDYNAIAKNLSYAQKPMTAADQLRMQQENYFAQQQFEMQQALYEQQMDTLRAQQQATQLRERAVEEQSRQSRPSLPPVIYFDREAGVMRNLSQEIVLGRVLTNAELKQLFHHFDLWRYGAENKLEQFQANRSMELLKQKLAANMAYAPERLVTEDGYIVVGDEAFNSQTAYLEALDYLNYFEMHEDLRPPKFPTDPRYLDPQKHDVTAKVKTLQKSILNEIGQAAIRLQFTGIIFDQFKNNFDNGGKWDTQGRYGLPTQSVIRDRHGDIVYKKNGFPDTRDQWGWFNGKPHRAGYISNYMFGYAAASILMPDWMAQGIGHGFSALSKLKKGEFPRNPRGFKRLLDDPDDQQGSLDGMNDFVNGLKR